MTKPLFKEDADSASVIPLHDGVGATLKSLRQARRVTLTEASGRIKFSVRQIQALEAEEWSSLPTGVPLRGLVKNYARLLEADVDAIMTMLEAQTDSAVTPRVAINAVPTGGPTFVPGELPSGAEERGFPWGWFLIIVVVLAVAGFYAFDRGWIPASWLDFQWLKSL
jgi:cytoskeletal protein RodZ